MNLTKHFAAAMLAVGHMAYIAQAQSSDAPRPPVLTMSEQHIVLAPPAPAINAPGDAPLVIPAPSVDGSSPALSSQVYGLPQPRWMTEGDSLMRGPLVGLEDPGLRPGWTAAIGVSILQPHVASQITSGSQTAGTFSGDPVQLPVGTMNFTGVPRIELGYRWREGLGEFRFAYQYLGAAGNRTIPDALPGSTRQESSILSINVIDCDYCFSELNPGDLPLLPMIGSWMQLPGRLGLRRPAYVYKGDPLAFRFRFGVRTATMFLDSHATGAQIVDERVTNNFGGAGIHFGIETTKAMPWHPLAIYNKLDFAGILGSCNQTFLRTDPTGAAGGTGAATVGPVFTGVPVFTAELGLNYVPVRYSKNLRGTLAWQYQQWFQFAETPDSTATLTLNGLVLRAEWGF